MNSADRTALAALLDSLRDESPRIAAAARERIWGLGEGALEALGACERSDDARLRVRARVLAHELRRARSCRRALEYAARDDDALDLEEGALHLSAVDDSAFDRTRCLAILDSIAESVKSRLRRPLDEGDLLDNVRGLARVLARDYRLHVPEDRYDDPENSFLHRVLERRQGIPISLAAVYLFVARRVGLPLSGIGTPGHFLLRVGPERLGTVLDPATGESMDLERATRMLAARGFSATPQSFTTATTRETLVRMCANLVSAYGKRRNVDGVQRWSHLRDAFRRRRSS